MDANYKPYKRYDDEFKRSAVELLETSERPMAEVAGDLGIPYKTLERWRALYRKRGDQTAGAADNPSGETDQAQLKELRRKLAHTERERDILKKALAICSREEANRGGSN